MARPILFALATTLGFTGPLAAQPAALPGAPVVRYDGHRIVRVAVGDEAELARMEGLGAQVWECEPRRGQVHFRIPPEAMAALDASGIAYTVVVADLQRQVDAENARLAGPARLPGAGGGIAGAGWFDDYKTFTQIYSYCVDLSIQFPDLAEFILIGNSLEGRPIFGLRIKGDAQGHCVPTLLLNSCQHAREWITPMVTVYFADTILRQYGIDPEITALVDSSEVIIIPVVNADGYEYTWSVDRFWRKNRRDNGGGDFGIDLNRNWGHEWGHNNGSSGDPGSDTYRGPFPFSEPETQVLRDFAESLPALRWHNDIHSHGQLILQPWGWTGDLPPDHALLDGIGAEAAALIKAVHNKTYIHGTCYEELYPISGGASDWFYGQNDTPSFLYELRGPGFDPPPSTILPCAQEMVPALLGHAAWIAGEFPFDADWDHNCRYELFDFLAYVNDFNAGKKAADFNKDGSLDLFDFLAFVNAFNAGK
jgi:carboxypeptidase A1